MPFFSKKSAKNDKSPTAGYKPFDFSAPDAFSEENLAKMSGVDTIAFDENDPALMDELAELGWSDDDDDNTKPSAAKTANIHADHRPIPGAPAPALPAGAREGGGPRRQPSGNEQMLRSLGLSLESVGDPELTEDDFNDPDLLKELGQFAGEGGHVGDLGGARGSRGDNGVAGPDRGSREGDFISFEDGADEPAVAATAGGRGGPPVLPPRGRSQRATTATTSSDVGGDGNDSGSKKAAKEIAAAEKQVEELRKRALELKKSGDREGALETLRESRAAESDLAVLHKLEVARKVATVETEFLAPSAATATQGHDYDYDDSDDNDEDYNSTSPSPAGAEAGGGAVSAELLMKKIKVLKQRAVELKKEGRTMEAMACLKRAKSLEADLLRDAQGKGLIAPAGQDGSGGGGGGRADLIRQASSRKSSLSSGRGRAREAVQAPASARKNSRSESQASPPSSVKAAMRPKAFPSDRDAFSDLEDALAVAIQLHIDRARDLVKTDRASAAKEVKRYKEFQTKLDLAREMRVVPGARPPAWQWKITKRSRIRVLEKVPMDQVEFEIFRVHGMTEKTNNKGSFWIKYDLGYSKDDKIGKGFTSSYRADADTVEMNFKVSSYVKRARSTKLAFQNRRINLEIFHKKNIMSREKSVGKCILQLQPLLSSCELSASSPILTEGRREAGGTVELLLRVRKPIETDEVIVTEEKVFELGEWPPIGSAGPVARVSTQPPAPSPAPVAAAAAAAAPAGGGGGGGSGGAVVQAEKAPRFQNVTLTSSEKATPFAVEHLDSNNVLEFEISAIKPKAVTGDLVALTRKGALETKLLMLESAVQSGELDLAGYCEIIRERITRDKVLALHLKGEKRTKEAVAVMKRIRAMEEELAGVPQEEEEDGPA